MDSIDGMPEVDGDFGPFHVRRLKNEKIGKRINLHDRDNPLLRVIVRTALRCVRKVLIGAEVAAAGLRQAFLRRLLREKVIRKLNLCSGTQRLTGWFAIDVAGSCDLKLDLSRNNLPFENGSLEAVACMSAINYFSRSRGQELALEMFRVLEPGGICRIGVQDMRALAQRYLNEDVEFFFEKLPDGRDRLEGPTIGDKFASWFYGYAIGARRCEYFYDYESLAYLFKKAGFSIVERRGYRDSRLADVVQLDNRPEQMFYLEAVK